MYLIIGSGTMAAEYARPLHDLAVDFTVVGRGLESAKAFEQQTGYAVISGGIDAFLQQASQPITGAIVAVGMEALFEVTVSLINYGVTRILVEKPAGMDIEQISALEQLARKKNARVYVAYNRRFFSSVIKAQQLIEAEGGVTSFRFELTEWGHVIKGLTKAPGVLDKLFLGNTSHVADLAFFLGGTPAKLTAFVNNACDWAPFGSNFTGAGVSVNNALFSYCGNWEAPGRWGVEMMTRESRLILQPMEQLWVQKLGSVQSTQVEVDDQLDKTYKPGIYRQLQAFLADDSQHLCGLAEHLLNTEYYYEMAGYHHS